MVPWRVKALGFMPRTRARRILRVTSRTQSDSRDDKQSDDTEEEEEEEEERRRRRLSTGTL